MRFSRYNRRFFDNTRIAVLELRHPLMRTKSKASPALPRGDPRSPGACGAVARNAFLHGQMRREVTAPKTPLRPFCSLCSWYLLLIHSKRSPTIIVLTDSDVGQAVPDCRSLCTDFIENQPWLRQAEPDLLVWCPNFPFLMRGPSAIQERIDLIPEREACLPLVGLAQFEGSRPPPQSFGQRGVHLPSHQLQPLLPVRCKLLSPKILLSHAARSGGSHTLVPGRAQWRSFFRTHPQDHHAPAPQPSQRRGTRSAVPATSLQSPSA